MEISRLEFLKRAGLLTAAGLVLPKLSFASPQNSKVQAAIKKGAKMKLSWQAFDAKMKHTFTVSGYSRTVTPIVLTQIEYGGLTGYGEAAMPPYLGETQASVIEFLKKVNLEQFSNPFELEDILAYVDSITTNNTAAKASVDIALHDLLGKLIGENWYSMWGYTRSKAPITSFTIGIDTPEVVREKAREASQYGLIKVKLGTENDKELVKTIREVTDLPMMVDANQGWKDKHHALEMINFCAENGFIFVEQPMPKAKLDDMAWITERSPIPTIADESCQRLADVSKLKGAFSGINIKLMKCTGMREAQKMITLARVLDMKVMIGCMTETSCAISAAAQLAPACDYADLDGNLLISNDVFEGAKVINGQIVPSDGPGIGVKKIG